MLIDLLCQYHLYMSHLDLQERPYQRMVKFVTLLVIEEDHLKME